MEGEVPRFRKMGGVEGGGGGPDKAGKPKPAAGAAAIATQVEHLHPRRHGGLSGCVQTGDGGNMEK